MRPASDGWRLLAYPLFLDQLAKLDAAVERVKSKDPQGWGETANATLLAVLRMLV